MNLTVTCDFNLEQAKIMAENFVAEYFSLLAISLVVISLRTVSRVSLLGIRRLQLDDYLMILAGVRNLGHAFSKNMQTDRIDIVSVLC